MSSIIKSTQVTTGNKFVINNPIEKVESNVMQEEKKEYKFREKAQKEAQEIINKAKEEAAQIKDNAIKEAEKFKEELNFEIQKSKENAQEEGYNEGLKLGQEKGFQDGLELINQILNNLKEKINLFYKDMEERMPKIKEDIVRLSIAISRKVISKELQINPQVINQILQESIKLLDGEEEIKIRVNPRDLEFLGNYKDELLKGNNSIEKVKLVEDESINDGGCIIESDFGGLDATIVSQLQEIEARLLEVINDE